MLATLPKLADRNFIIGFLLPILLGALATLFLFRDTDAAQSILVAVLRDTTLSDLTLIAVAVWTGATLLALLNYHFYRILEGYAGPLKQEMGRQCRLTEHTAELAFLRQEPPETASAAVRSAYYDRRAAFNLRFPRREDLVLPTRFGNVIRAFESYPERVYGADSIPIWPRLQAVLPKDFAGMIADARAQVDFFVNLVVLGLLIGVVAIVRLLINQYFVQYCARPDGTGFAYCALHGWNDARFRWDLLVWSSASFAVARTCYKLAVDRAIAWGIYVRSAFDLYLPVLASQLGYDVPLTNEGRIRFWRAVNSLFLYGAPINDQTWPRRRGAAPGPQAGAGDANDDDSGN